MLFAKWIFKWFQSTLGFPKMFVLESTVGFWSKNEVLVMLSNNCSIITGQKIPGAQPSLFYPFKRAKQKCPA